MGGRRDAEKASDQVGERATEGPGLSRPLNSNPCVGERWELESVPTARSLSSPSFTHDSEAGASAGRPGSGVQPRGERGGI